MRISDPTPCCFTPGLQSSLEMCVQPQHLRGNALGGHGPGLPPTTIPGRKPSMAKSMDAETRRAETSTQCTSKVLPSQHHPTQPWCEPLSPGHPATIHALLQPHTQGRAGVSQSRKPNVRVQPGSASLIPRDGARALPRRTGNGFEQLWGTAWCLHNLNSQHFAPRPGRRALGVRSQRAPHHPSP